MLIHCTVLGGGFAVQLLERLVEGIWCIIAAHFNNFNNLYVRVSQQRCRLVNPQLPDIGQRIHSDRHPTDRVQLLLVDSAILTNGLYG